MKKHKSRGVAILEFSLITLVLVPLMLGTMSIGLNMIRSLQTVQLARDAGHMYARGVDFSLPGNQTILTTIGADLGLTTSATHQQGTGGFVAGDLRGQGHMRGGGQGRCERQSPGLHELHQVGVYAADFGR